MTLNILQLIFSVLFAVALILWWKKVWERRNASANAWMVPFAHFSSVAWTLWVLQYAVLAIGPLGLLESNLSRTTGLWLAAMQNFLWIMAILSLISRHFSRVSLILAALAMIAIIVAAIIFLTPIVTVGVVVQILDAVTTAAIFLVLTFSIWQLRVSKVYAVCFGIHGYCQWIWKFIYFPPSIEIQELLLLLFPFWHLALLFVWNKLITEMRGRFRVMISSTIKDLGEERRAADRAIRSLDLEGLRSETIGSRPYTPTALCRLWAEQCNTFILITGERYGHPKSKAQSVVEFEFEVARERDPGKILVYIKEGVTREPKLQDFVDRLDDFNNGYVTSRFNTAEELEPKIRDNLTEWLASHPEERDGEAWY
jgi:Domain of unknown function (DUF4062)